MQHDRFLARRELADGGLGRLASRAGPTHPRARNDVARLAELCPNSFGIGLHDFQDPARTARILEFHGAAGVKAPQPCTRQRQRCIGRYRCAAAARRCQPYARGGRNPPIRIALGTNLDHRRTGLQRAGAQLGAAEIHRHEARPAERTAGSSKMLDHPGPHVRVVMGAVDPHAVHAVANELVHEGVVASGFRRHRDHDAHAAIGRGRPEQRLRMRFEEFLLARRVWSRRLLTIRVLRQCLQCGSDRSDRRQHAGFGAAQ